MNESQLGLFYGLSFLCVALAFAFAAYLYLWVKKQKTENAKIQEVSLLIKQGANTFMRREYLVLAKFAGVAAIVSLVLLPSPIWTVGLPVRPGGVRHCRQNRHLGGHPGQRPHRRGRPEGH